MSFLVEDWYDNDVSTGSYSVPEAPCVPDDCPKVSIKNTIKIVQMLLK